MAGIWRLIIASNDARVMWHQCAINSNGNGAARNLVAAISYNRSAIANVCNNGKRPALALMASVMAAKPYQRRSNMCSGISA